MNTPKVKYARFRPSNPPSTVLFIGDRLGALKQIGFAVQHAGHSVLWTESGHAGLRFVECERPALIICEIDVPDISGIDVCNAIRTAGYLCDVPIVLVGRPGHEMYDLPQAFAAGADEFFVSLSDRQLILAKLDWLLRKRNAFANRSNCGKPIERPGAANLNG